MVQDPDATNRANAYDSLTAWIKVNLDQPDGWSIDLSPLRSIAVQYPIDSSFRIATLQLAESADSYRHFGLLQFRAVDTLIYLQDSEVRDYSTYYTEARQWEGALYYDMLEFEPKGELRRFVLFGFDGYRGYAHRKVAEVIAVDPKEGKANFVAGTFQFDDEKKSQIDLVYAAEVPIRLHYNDSLEMIIHEHLIPMPSVYQKGRTVMVADGSYEGFRWEDDHWRHVPKVFDQVNDGPPGKGLPESRKQQLFKN